MHILTTFWRACCARSSCLAIRCLAALDPLRSIMLNEGILSSVMTRQISTFACSLTVFRPRKASHGSDPRALLHPPSPGSFECIALIVSLTLALRSLEIATQSTSSSTWKVIAVYHFVPLGTRAICEASPSDCIAHQPLNLTPCLAAFTCFI
jgi:hypothetical protein